VYARLRAAVKGLDRPGGRLLLAGIASARLTAKLRKPVLMRREYGAWVFRWNGVTLPHPSVGSALHPEEARDIFTHVYSPKVGDVVFDVGAGVGDSTLLFSRLVGAEGRVVAIEAHPEAHRWLVRLCESNELTNVVPLQLAVSDGDGEVLISDADTLTNAIIGQEAPEARLAVEARRLDEVACGLGVERIDFLKMNIEGAEGLALIGMAELLSKTRNVCISCHDFIADRGGPDDMRTKAFVSEYLTARGFSVVSRGKGADHVRSYVYGINNNVSPLTQ
jgi:FkbM family methyltransferase